MDSGAEMLQKNRQTQLSDASAGADWRTIAAAWERETQSQDPGAIARATHNLAVLYHSMAIEEEAMGWVAMKVDQPLSDHEMEDWRKALAFWHEVWRNALYLNYVKQRAVALNDPRLSSNDIDDIWSDKLPQLILGTSAALASGYFQAGCLRRAAQHVGIGLNSPFDQLLTKKAYEKVLSPVRDRLKEQCQEAEKALNKERSHAREIYEQLLTGATVEMQKMAQVDPNDLICGPAIKDEVAKTLMSAATGFANETEDWGQTITMLKHALEIAASNSMREAIKRSIETCKENAGFLLDSFDYSKCWICGTRPANPKKARVVKMHKVTEQQMLSVSYRKLDLKIPRCAACSASSAAFWVFVVLTGGATALWALLMMAVGPLSVPGIAGLVITLLAGAAGCLLPALVYSRLARVPWRAMMSPKTEKCPVYEAAIGSGWSLGEKPPGVT